MRGLIDSFMVGLHDVLTFLFVAKGNDLHLTKTEVVQDDDGDEHNLTVTDYMVYDCALCIALRALVVGAMLGGLAVYLYLTGA